MYRKVKYLFFVIVLFLAAFFTLVFLDHRGAAEISWIAYSGFLIPINICVWTISRLMLPGMTSHPQVQTRQMVEGGIECIKGISKLKP